MGRVSERGRRSPDPSTLQETSGTVFASFIVSDAIPASVVGLSFVYMAPPFFVSRDHLFL